MVRDGEDPALPDEDDGDGVCPDCDQIWDMCECHVGADCGRWRNGHLSSSCAKAGSEECDFECPYRNSLYGGATDGVNGSPGETVSGNTLRNGKDEE